MRETNETKLKPGGTTGNDAQSVHSVYLVVPLNSADKLGEAFLLQSSAFWWSSRGLLVASRGVSFWCPDGNFRSVVVLVVVLSCFPAVVLVVDRRGRRGHGHCVGIYASIVA